jgi:hypothetical protein
MIAKPNSLDNINIFLTSAQLPLEIFKYLVNCLLLYSEPSAILFVIETTAL